MPSLPFYYTQNSIIWNLDHNRYSLFRPNHIGASDPQPPICLKNARRFRPKTPAVPGSALWSTHMRQTRDPTASLWPLWKTGNSGGDEM